MKPIFLKVLFFFGPFIVLVTPFEYSTTISVGYENGSQVKRDCYPDSGAVYCPTLEDAREYIVRNISKPKSVQVKVWKSCSWNSTLDMCESTPIILSNQIPFLDLSKFALVGATKGITILCKPENSTIGAGLAFVLVHGLVIGNLTLDGCGAYFQIALGVKSTIDIVDCTDVTLENMSFRNGTGLGVVIVQTGGIVKIVESVFEYNYATGLYIQPPASTRTPSNYTIHNCTFELNSLNVNHTWGGGMLLFFMDAERGINVNILRCSFNQNVASEGGGLYIHVIYPALKNPNSIMIVGCSFSKNIGTDRGGGVFIILQTENNHITFRDCKFDGNYAMRGGGVFLDTSSGNNTLKFYNCTWYRNKGTFTAAAVELSSSVLTSSKPVPVFDNCQFIGNEAQYIPFSIGQSTTQWNMTRGTLVVIRYEVHFSGSVVFENNMASGIYAVFSLIKFHADMNAKFINNFGINGGAIALRLSSSLQVKTNSILLFANNSALLRGAAIYADHIDDYISSECFFRFDTITENVTITFLDNFAYVYAKSYRDQFGEAVNATLFGCYSILHDYKKTNTAGTLSIYDLLSCVANITFKGPSLMEPRQLMVEEQVFNSQGEVTNSISGKEFDISFEIEGEMQRDGDTVYKTFILSSNNVTIDPAYSYISTGILKVYGSPGLGGILVLERIGYPEVYLSVNVSLQQCPPGYIRHLAECSCAWNHEQAYQGILKCNSTLFQASILHGFWAGYDSEPATPDNLFSAPCPRGFCSYNTTGYSVFHLLPNTASKAELEISMCGTQRTGRLCGKCRDGHSVYFHSSNYRCSSNRHCRFGALFYIISEILPVTIMFITVMVFNINFTSGAVNGFIFFAQVLDTLAVDANGTVHLPKGVHLLTQVYQLIYRFFNLEFFGIDSLSFCLWKGATTLDILAFKYITVAYALVLVVMTVMLMNLCIHCFYRVFPCLKPCLVRNSVIHGLSAFLVMCYTQCTLVSLRILTRIFLEGLGSSQAVVFYSGDINYFSAHHMIYGTPALICLATIVALPPILLLLYPAAWRILAVCHINNETKYIGQVLTMIERFKPILDSFQSCFKDNFRFFAGLYFIYRMSAQFTYVAVSLTHFYTVVEIQVIIMFMLHASVQPYEKRWHNIVDAFLFADLAAINGLTMFIYSHATGGKVRARDNGITVAAYIQLVLILLPLVYIAVYILIQLMMKLKPVLKDNRDTTPPGEDNELPARLLEMEDSHNEDFNYRAFHSQHELKTFHN